MWQGSARSPRWEDPAVLLARRVSEVAKRKHSLSESRACGKAEESTLHAPSQRVGDAGLKPHRDSGCGREAALAGAHGQLLAPRGVGVNHPSPAPLCSWVVSNVQNTTLLSQRQPVCALLALSLLCSCIMQDRTAQPAPSHRRPPAEQVKTPLLRSNSPRSRPVCCQREDSSPQSAAVGAALLCR